MNKQRHLDQQLQEHFDRYKQVMVLLGSRQVGKTTILKRLFPQAEYFLIDNEPIRKIFETYDIQTYKTLIPEKVEHIVIDEVHLLNNPGRAVKILYDQLNNLKITITGSSSLHIKNKTGESLAGRKIDYHMYPLTFSEYLQQKNIEKELNFNILEKVVGPEDKMSARNFYKFDMAGILAMILIYGQYPFLIESPRDERYLLNFVDSLIFKDIMELQLIEDKKLASNLLKLLAFQIGNLVNYSELADSLGADQRTVKRYIEIFEQSFIIYRLYPYTTNKRNEISKSPKIYFADTGIRNAIINNFIDLEIRPDKGALFENFIINELIKQNDYTQKGYKFYYWRTKQGSEVDLVMEKNNDLIALEIKYKKGAVSRAFKNRYPQARQKVITANNFY